MILCEILLDFNEIYHEIHNEIWWISHELVLDFMKTCEILLHLMKSCEILSILVKSWWILLDFM